MSAAAPSAGKASRSAVARDCNRSPAVSACRASAAPIPGAADDRAPLPKGRVARSAAEAETIAAELGGALVLKSQVLTGGRMKAGGVKFAQTPEEAEAAARDILALRIKDQEPRGVLVEQRAPVAQEYFAAVTWDGRRKLPVVIFSDMGGIDIEEVAERHPEHVSRTHLSTLLPFSPYTAK